LLTHIAKLLLLFISLYALIYLLQINFQFYDRNSCRVDKFDIFYAGNDLELFIELSHFIDMQVSVPIKAQPSHSYIHITLVNCKSTCH